ncbi:MAG: hypothetical protein IKG65_14530 [Exiguobacterium sp.]|nr:hypothetical protein [Exiguobacterium sp.]MBR2758027.1 hypothetical protein [Exiguobacterium sp.]MBR3063596.1 hypothetical protein [Exiguobacterium sp.]MBR3216039.1 hypothetical protein [Exiguobacterium sp.]
MLSWLGMTKSGKTGPPFFGDVSKRAVTLVLFSSLILMLEDAIVAVLPGIVGLLVALVYILVLERLLHDQAMSRNDADEM